MTDLKIIGEDQQIIKEKQEINEDSEAVYDDCKQKTELLIKRLIDLENDDEKNIKKIYLYIKGNFVQGRLLYSVISTEIFNIPEFKIDELQHICDRLVSYAYSLNNLQEDDKTARKVVLKLSDHINLALAQERYISQLNNESLNNSFDKVDEFMTKSYDIEAKIENMNGQVISILGVFTAISFVVFGGISSASSIFKNINSASLPKLGVLTSIWSIAICNMVYFLLYFMSKMTGTNIKTNLRWNAPVYRRHPYIFLINSFLIATLLISAWLCIIEKAKGNSWIMMIVANNKNFLLFGTLLLIILIVVFFIVLLFKMSSDRHDY